MQRLEFTQPDFEQKLANFCAVNETPRSIVDAVTGVLNAVRADGDAAVCKFTERFDGVQLTPCLLYTSPSPRD